MTSPAIRTVTDALVAMLRTATGFTVGDAQVPGDTAPPYLILYALPSGSPLVTMANPEDGVELSYQVTAVAERRDQGDLVLDKARVAVFSRLGSGEHEHAIAGAGFTVCARTWIGYSPTAPDLSLGLVSPSERFSLLVTWP